MENWRAAAALNNFVISTRETKDINACFGGRRERVESVIAAGWRKVRNYLTVQPGNGSSAPSDVGFFGSHNSSFLQHTDEDAFEESHTKEEFCYFRARARKLSRAIFRRSFGGSGSFT